jgi:parvulin-like peptidyl-prolyl isomerase
MNSSHVFAQSPAVARPTKPDAYLDQVVATVETRRITRRDVARAYLDFETNALDPAKTADKAQPAAGSDSDIAKITPQIFHHGLEKARPVDTTGPNRPHPVTTAELHRLAQRLFTADTPDVQAIVETLMREQALEIAAERRNIHITDAEVRLGVHQVLESLRASREAPDIPGETDHQLAQLIGTKYNLQAQAVRERLLARALTISDLNDRLGHVPQQADFYRAHLILVPVDIKSLASADADWRRAHDSAAQLRADLIAGKQKLEDAARQKSDDPTSRSGGDLGPLVRTLLPADVERTVLNLKPGEVSEPVRIKSGYLLLRLDKRGAEMTDVERRAALEVCYRSTRRRKNALARMLKDIAWNNTVGPTPEWFRRPATN